MFERESRKVDLFFTGMGVNQREMFSAKNMIDISHSVSCAPRAIVAKADVHDIH